MNKICLIGNSGIKHNNRDGQTTKVRLYLEKIKDEGFDVDFVDLEDFFKHPFYIFRRIKKGIKSCDRIVLISAERGCKVLIPYINRINRKYKKPFILPIIGSSVLHYSIDNLSDEQKYDFLNNHNYSMAKKNKKISKQLQKISYILVETESQQQTFREFYELNNACVLNNFRDQDILVKKEYKPSVPLKLVFLSRVMSLKGIFDLLEVVKDINKNEILVTLDIYGNKYFLSSESVMFDEYSKLDFINYKGNIKAEDVVNIINKYDLFVFPTRAAFEGTPGVIAESLIAGTPILTSNFPQAKYLMKDGYDSIYYEMFDEEDLKEKLLSIINNKDILSELSKNASKSGEKFTYLYNRKQFLKYVCGQEE